MQTRMSRRFTEKNTSEHLAPEREPNGSTTRLATTCDSEPNDRVSHQVSDIRIFGQSGGLIPHYHTFSNSEADFRGSEPCHLQSDQIKHKNQTNPPKIPQGKMEGTNEDCCTHRRCNQTTTATAATILLALSAAVAAAALLRKAPGPTRTTYKCCAATTRAGRRCSRAIPHGQGPYCWQHYPRNPRPSPQASPYSNPASNRVAVTIEQDHDQDQDQDQSHRSDGYSDGYSEGDSESDGEGEDDDHDSDGEGDGGHGDSIAIAQ